MNPIPRMPWNSPARSRALTQARKDCRSSGPVDAMLARRPRSAYSARPMRREISVSRRSTCPLKRAFNCASREDLVAWTAVTVTAIPHSSAAAAASSGLARRKRKLERAGGTAESDKNGAGAVPEWPRV